MSRYLLKTYFRNQKKHLFHSIINIAGFAIGIACSILILLWINQELSFDDYHKGADRIYRVLAALDPAHERIGPYTPPPLAEAFKEDFPEIEQTARISLWPRKLVVSYKEKLFVEDKIFAADNTLFKIFSFEFLQGDPEKALKNPFTIVITESFAEKYFSKTEDPIGKIVHFNSTNQDFLITGVIEDCRCNSHIQFDALISLNSTKKSYSNEWMGHCYFTYLLLREGSEPDTLRSKFPSFIMKHYGPQFFNETGISLKDYFADKNNYYNYDLQPLSDIHLNSAIVDNIPNHGDIRNVYIFTAVAVFILLIACINFINLSTARSINRSKEVGLKKVLGSDKLSLIKQFVSESVLTILIAFIIAIILIITLFPYMNSYIEREVSYGIFLEPSIIITIIALFIVISLLAASYPAFILSGFKPTEIFQSFRHSGAKGKYVRKTLVIFQFTALIIIMIGTLFIYLQKQYMRQADIGFDKKNLLIIHRVRELGNNQELLRHELLKNPHISAVSYTNTLPGRHYDDNGHNLEGRSSDEEIQLCTMYSDQYFRKLLDLKMTDGRFFLEQGSNDENSVIINEAAARVYGTTDLVGKRFKKEFGDAKDGEYVTIIGVVKDFNIASHRYQMLPMIIRNLPESKGIYATMRISQSDIDKTLAFVEQTWNRLSNGSPFEYSFLEDDLNNLYKEEDKIGLLLSIFSSLMIIIACLGLLGLVSFSMQQKRKEISIRKINGASILDISILLLKESMILIAMANIISWPIAYYIVNKWLENFALQINISLLPFISVGIFIFTLVLITISYQTIKESFRNPIDSLRYE